jgi:hypothetical protein
MTFLESGAAQESNLPTDGLHAPAGFEEGRDLALRAGVRVVSDHLGDHPAVKTSLAEMR